MERPAALRRKGGGSRPPARRPPASHTQMAVEEVHAGGARGADDEELVARRTAAHVANRLSWVVPARVTTARSSDVDGQHVPGDGRHGADTSARNSETKCGTTTPPAGRGARSGRVLRRRRCRPRLRCGRSRPAGPGREHAAEAALERELVDGDDEAQLARHVDEPAGLLGGGGHRLLHDGVTARAQDAVGEARVIGVRAHVDDGRVSSQSSNRRRRGTRAPPGSPARGPGCASRRCRRGRRPGPPLPPRNGRASGPCGRRPRSPTSGRRELTRAQRKPRFRGGVKVSRRKGPGLTVEDGGGPSPPPVTSPRRRQKPSQTPKCGLPTLTLSRGR